MVAMSKELVACNLIFIKVLAILIISKWKKFFTALELITENAFCKSICTSCPKRPACRTFSHLFKFNSDSMAFSLKKQNLPLLNIELFTNWQSILVNH